MGFFEVICIPIIHAASDGHNRSPLFFVLLKYCILRTFLLPELELNMPK